MGGSNADFPCFASHCLAEVYPVSLRYPLGNTSTVSRQNLVLSEYHAVSTETPMV